MGKWNDKCLDDYFDLMHERPNAFTQSPILSIVTDKHECSHSWKVLINSLVLFIKAHFI